jgi:hypothetical protein
MVNSETSIITVTPKLVVTKTGMVEGWGGGDGQGLSKERWDQYQRLFKDIGLRGGFSRGEAAISFKVDVPSLSNGDSEKGIEYSQKVPEPIVSDLERFEPPKRDRDKYGGFTAYKSLSTAHWYLYLHVN